MNPKIQGVTLNDIQQKAAETITGPLLIIAGAGSGKTRVVTTRIALMLDSGIPQKNILALTFTNKAAREMQNRIRELTGMKLQQLTVSTFHAFGVKLLKKYAPLLGYDRRFTIYDEVDKVALLKEVLREAGKQSEKVDFYELIKYLSAVKLGRAIDKTAGVDMDKLYVEYNDHLKVYNALDFDDLIALPIRLFQEHPDALAECQDTYRYVLVDEFQDTSAAQYRIVRALAEVSRNLCVVGDDDQSIYSWRGANFENIAMFERDFPERLEIKLEQNYRSSKDILDAANNLIQNNTNRKAKSLWTGKAAHSAIEHIMPEDEHAESAFLTRTIRTQAIRLGVDYSQFGILVRTNNLMDTIEEALMADNIPYKVSGGMSFFGRKEIRDLICYLKVIANPHDDVSLLRILNVPRRGIGKTTVRRLREYATAKSLSLYTALHDLVLSAPGEMVPRTVESLTAFHELIDTFKERMLSGKSLSSGLAELVSEVNYWGFLLLEHQGRDSLAKYKFGNVQRFIDMLDTWERDPDTIDPNLFDFLSRISLVTRDDLSNEEDRGKVNLMTIHAAKGLEFDVVFIAGAEERFIPHARALEENPESIEEERRLFYVAITRAKEKLYISSCRQRRIMREICELEPSRFLEEIPADLVVRHQEETAVTGEAADDFFALMKTKLGNQSRDP